MTIPQNTPLAWQLLLEVCPEPPKFTEEQKDRARQRLKELRAKKVHWSELPEHNMEILKMESVIYE